MPSEGSSIGEGRIILLRWIIKQNIIDFLWIALSNPMMMKRAELFGKRNHVLCQKQAWLDITVQKFHDFSTTQILREINFGDS